MPDIDPKTKFPHFPGFRYSLTKEFNRSMSSQTTTPSYTIARSEGQSKRAVRIYDDGVIEEVEITRSDYDEYTVPPDGEYRFKIIGYYVPWEEKITNPEWIKDGKTHTTKTKLDLETKIQEGRGKGRKFAANIGWSLGERSNMRKVWLAALGYIPDKDEAEMNDLLGAEFKCYMQVNESANRDGVLTKYPNPTWATAKPVSATNESDDDWTS